MKLLVIDTSDKAASCALLDRETILAETILNTGMKKHSVTLMPMVSAMMESAGVKPAELGGIACTVGPGSFTGIRIGVATAKAMAYALGINAAGINSLDAMAYGGGVLGVLSKGGLICPMIDARNRQVYTSVYRYSDFENPVPERISEYDAVPLECIAAQLNEIACRKGIRNILVLGNGLRNNFDFWQQESIKQEKRYKLILSDPISDIIRASSVGRYSIIGEQFKDPTLLMPYYIRSTQAERMKELVTQNERNNRS